MRMKIRKSKAELRKEAIFDAALACFNRKGYHKTSLDDIAARVGFTKSALYYYFKSKKRLFVDLFLFKIDRYFTKTSQSVLYSHHDPVGYLKRRIERSDEVFKKNIDLFKFCLEFLSISTRDPEIKREVTRFYENRVQEFASMIQRGIDEGKFRECDSQAVGTLFYYLSIGSFLTYFSVSKRFDRVLHFKVFLDLLYKGIMKQ
jgi:AcrR family transcriptional regulator